MIYESITGKLNSFLGAYTIKLMLTLAIATSIDALIVGFSFSFLDISIFIPSIIIGIVAFLMSFFGVYIGKRFGKIPKKQN